MAQEVPTTGLLSGDDIARMIDQAAHTPALAARVRAAVAGHTAADVPRIAHDTVMNLDEAALSEALSGVDRFQPNTTPRDSEPAADDAMAQLEKLSDAHEERFGFLIVIASAGRPVEALLDEARARLALPDRDSALAAARSSLAAILAGRLTRAIAAA